MFTLIYQKSKLNNPTVYASTIKWGDINIPTLYALHNKVLIYKIDDINRNSSGNMDEDDGFDFSDDDDDLADLEDFLTKATS